MPTPADTLALWRAEIVTEIEQLEAELAEASAAFTLADAAYRDRQAGWSELRDVAARGLGEHEGMAGALRIRVEDARSDALRDASHTRGVAMASKKSLGERIAGRRLALVQIDRALSTDKTTSARTSESARKKPQPIDFDNIVMPQEA